jgi:hypothetical protein
MTAGLAPEDVRAIDAARDAQLEHVRALGAPEGNTPGGRDNSSR